LKAVRISQQPKRAANEWRIPNEVTGPSPNRQSPIENRQSLANQAFHNVAGHIGQAKVPSLKAVG
jgi:hypothetical protein